MKNMMKIFGALVVGMACLFATSCSSELSTDDMLGKIPAKSAVVIKMNSTQSLTNAGGEITDDGIELPKAIKDLMNNGMSKSEKRTLENVLNLKGLNYDQAYMVFEELDFNASKPDFFLMLNVTDEGDFADGLDELGFDKDDDDEGYTRFSFKKDCYIFVKDHVAWVSLDRKAVRKIEKFLEHADKESLKDVEWARKAFDNENTLTCLVNLGEAIPAGMVDALSNEIDPMAQNILSAVGNGNVILSVSFEGNTANASLSFFDAKGKELDFGKYAAPINPAFLKYVSANDIAVAACGVKASNNIPYLAAKKELERMMEYSYSESDRMGAALVSDLLKNLDGTVAVAVGPKEGCSLQDMARGPQYCDFVIYAEMKPGEAEKLSKTVAMGSQQGGYKVGVAGNALIVSTRSLTPANPTKEFTADAFKGKLLAAKALVQAKQIQAIRLPFDVEGSVVFDKNVLSAKVTLNGTKSGFLGAVLDFVVSAAISNQM